MDRLTIFWILMAVSTLLFVAGLGANLSIWLTGRTGPATPRSKTAKFWSLSRVSAQTVFSRRVGLIVKAVVLDGLLHQALFRENKPRWLAHTLLALGFLFLFALSTFTGFFEEVLHLMFKVETPFVLAVVNKDTPVMALLNEVLGIPLILGLAFIIVRRYIAKPSQLRTAGADTSILVLLGVGLLTAYPTEALRFLMEGTPASLGGISFIGYPLAQAMKPLALQWAQWHFAMFFIHVVPFMILLVYMPFSKFFHVLVSPIVAAVNSLREEAA